MKKNMKKIVSLVLAMVMIFAMNVTTFAATSSLTINTATGHSYEVYQMLIGDVSSLANGSGTLANVEAGQNLAGTVAEFDAAIKGDDGKYLTGTALSAAALEKITGQPVATLSGASKSATVADGYYVVKDVYTDNEIECAAYMVAVVGPTTMDPKTSIPDIDKNITDTDANAALETGDSKKTDTAAIGDVINYKAESAVPVTEGYEYYYYVVNDTMSEGLTFNKDLVIKIGGTALPADEYTLTQDDQGFKLVVIDMKKYTAGAAIEITYSATVNENAKIGTEANTNTINLTYSNNPSDTFGKKPNDNHEPDDDDVVGVTPDHITKTYVTEVSIQKTDADAKAFIDALKGATFTLTGTGLNDVKLNSETVFEVAADGEYYKLKDGTYTKTEPNDNTADKYDSTTVKYNTVTKVSLTEAESGQELNITAVVDATGKITFTGLNAGSYKIVETNVPAGYNKCEDIEFTISASQTGATALEGGAITWTSSNAAVEEVKENGVGLGLFEATIANQKGNLLPSTGGIGTTIFYVMGTILALGAGIILVAKRRVAR